MTETTKEERDRWRDLIEDYELENKGDQLSFRVDVVKALLNDADRLAEMEASTKGFAMGWDGAMQRLAKLERAARRVVNSGVLCDPGCCGDDCGCDELRKVLEK